jgi:MFS family permease
MAARTSLSVETFAAWGWRIPFLVSVVLLGLSLWIRLRLAESPVFQRMKAEAQTSKAPLAEAFGNPRNVRMILAALIGGVAGGTTLWYTAQFYTLFFLERVLKVDALTANTLVAIALVVAAPSYVFFGWLSDKIGRRTVVMGGLVFALASYFPGFHLLTTAANPGLARAQETAPIVVFADASLCTFQFDPVGRTAFDQRSCDIAKSYLSKAGVSYGNETLAVGAGAEVHVGARVVKAPEGSLLSGEARKAAITAFQDEMRAALDAAGYSAAADPAQIDRALVVSIIAYFAILAAASYAPIGAWFVELFPARIRYTSLSVPYHIGAGWIGGLLPTTVFAIVASTGNIYAGLWYPLSCAVISLIVGLTLLPETKGRPID